MEKEKGYNGFTNYETWAVSLWLGNDSGTYHYWREATEEEWAGAAAADAGPERTSHLTPREAATISLAKRLQDEVESGSPLTDASLYSDLLQGALDEVDWYEIADNYLEEAQEEKRL